MLIKGIKESSSQGSRIRFTSQKILDLIEEDVAILRDKFLLKIGMLDGKGKNRKIKESGKYDEEICKKPAKKNEVAELRREMAKLKGESNAKIKGLESQVKEITK